MNLLERVLERLARDLDALRVRWALVGGLAVSARSEPRFTRDIDAAVAVPDQRAAEGIVRDLMRRGYSLTWALTDPTGRMLGARLAPVSEGEDPPVVDLLFGSTSIEPEVVEAASPMKIGDFMAPVATLGHLLAMKLLSAHPDRRPQDLVDLRALVRTASPLEVERAREAVRTITSRGAHRGKDLALELESALSRYRSP